MKRKPKDLPLDELIRQFIRVAQSLEKSSGGQIRLRLEFGPKRDTQGKSGEPR